MNKTLTNYRITNAVWSRISSVFPPELELGEFDDRPRIPQRVILQAILYWLADGLLKRRCKQYLGISYGALAQRLDEWSEAGVFTHWQTLDSKSLIALYELLRRQNHSREDASFVIRSGPLGSAQLQISDADV